MSTPVALLITVVLLAVNALFVAAEFALLTARRHRLEQLAGERRRGAAAALAGVKELSLMLAAAQLGITMASLGLGIIGEPAIAHALEPLLDATGLPSGVSYAIAFAIALSVVVFLHMVVGEMMPKSWAITHPESAALRLAGPFRGFALVFRPVLRLMNALANAVVRLCGVTPVAELAVAHTPSDLARLVQESAEHGTLDPDEGALLGRALSLHRLDVRAVKTPRSAMVAVPAGADAADIEQVALDSGRSRLPVIGADLDDVLGVVHVKDLLLLDPAGTRRAGVTAGSLARPAMFAAETEPADDLLVRMRRGKNHLALVVDEHGGIGGLVTFEDLVEELIGDVEDETDPQSQAVHSGALSGALRLDEVERQTGLKLTARHTDTLAGWVTERLHRIAAPGDVVRADGVVATVLQVDGPRIASLTLHAHNRGREVVDGQPVRPIPAGQDPRPVDVASAEKEPRTGLPHQPPMSSDRPQATGEGGVGATLLAGQQAEGKTRSAASAQEWPPQSAASNRLAAAAVWSGRLLLVVAAVTVAGYVLVRLRLVVLPLVLGAAVAALLVGQVDWLSRGRFPRAAAALLVTLGWAATVLAAMGLVAARVSGQTDELRADVQAGLAQLRGYLGNVGVDERQLASLQDSATRALTDNQQALASGVISGASLLAELLAGYFLFIVVLFFFLRDGRSIWKWVVARHPRATARAVDAGGRAALVTLAAYLRGTAVIALVDAALIGLALLLLGVPLVLPLALLVFLGAFIPVVGSVIAGSVAVLVALVTEGPLTAGLALAAVVVVQQLEGDVLAPVVFGRALSLHPLVVVVALTAGAVLAGVLGAAVSVPLVAAAWAVLRAVRPEVSGTPTPESTHAT